MSPKPDERGFKPGANMPHGDYDPKKQGMSDSGNHAVGHPGNDTPYGYQNEQQGRGPARSEQALQQDNQNRADERNLQSAEDAAKAATHRDKTTGLRGDDYTKDNREGGKR